MRRLSLRSGETEIAADADRPLSLAIPLRFDAAQPSAFGAPAATVSTYRAGGFVGDVASGGSCNCREYRVIPHCNGTHTECIGHVTQQAVNVNDVVKGGLEPALLLSIAVLTAEGCTEDSDPRPQPQDKLITAQAIEAAWRQRQWPGVVVKALVLRTLPNTAEKLTHQYSDIPPYLTRQAVQLLVARGIEHLLIDVPSMDRTDDGGKLTGHRLFWGLPPGSVDVMAATRPEATITELMFAPDEIPDGRYLLDLQLAPFVADAAPSRPLLYPVIDQN